MKRVSPGLWNKPESVCLTDTPLPPCCVVRGESFANRHVCWHFPPLGAKSWVHREWGCRRSGVCSGWGGCLCLTAFPAQCIPFLLPLVLVTPVGWGVAVCAPGVRCEGPREDCKESPVSRSGCSVCSLHQNSWDGVARAGCALSSPQVC